MPHLRTFISFYRTSPVGQKAEVQNTIKNGDRSRRFIGSTSTITKLLTSSTETCNLSRVPC